MDIFITVSLVFMVWMCLDCIQRKEHFIWIVIMVVCFPVGALAYYFMVKARTGQSRLQLFSTNPGTGAPPPTKEVDTEETLQFKELINKFHKPYHYEKLGQIYFDQKKYEQAAAQFREAIKRDPEMNEARYGLAKSLYGMERYEESAAVLEELVQIDKKYDYGNAIFGLAECYRLAGMEDKALETYREVIHSFSFFKAYYHYARLLDKQGKTQEAIDCMKSMIGTSKDLPEYKLEKEKFWISEAYKYLQKHGIELA